MSHLKAARKQVDHCKKCQKPIKDFAAYIPEVGEVCMRCWVEYVASVEGEMPVSNRVPMESGQTLVR